MKKVIGVRFRTAGKIYYFSPGDLPVKRGSHVIVETSRGLEYGRVVGDPMELEDKKVPQPLKTVLRMATPEDEEQERTNRIKEREAFEVCLSKIRRHELDMKLIDAEYTFDNSKILFYFTADGRVDFRDLVKDLAGVFRTRIELRQIGVRDETKILGGIGICGRALCCHSYLSDFVPVSIKMAKEQNLSLNPTKISGVCGRLMCCLKNEEDTYEELNRNLPGIGDEVEGDDGLRGEVESVNVLRQTVRILVEVDDEKELHEYGVDHLTVLRRRRRGGNRQTGGKKEKNGENLSGANENSQREDKGEQEGKNRQNHRGHGGRPGRGGQQRGEQEQQTQAGSAGQRPERSERADRGERSERQDRADRTERLDRQERPERADRQDRQDRPERADRQDRQERPDRTDRQDRQDRYNRQDREDRNNRKRKNAAPRNNGQTEPKQDK